MANDSSPTYFVYEKDPLNYVVIGLTSDPIWARNGQKHIENRLKFASGTIETSLWESMNDANANPMLALELSEIFAWSIDFFGVQQGDHYKVIYEESYRGFQVHWDPQDPGRMVLPQWNRFLGHSL